MAKLSRKERTRRNAIIRQTQLDNDTRVAGELRQIKKLESDNANLLKSKEPYVKQKQELQRKKRNYKTTRKRNKKTVDTNQLRKFDKDIAEVSKQLKKKDETVRNNKAIITQIKKDIQRINVKGQRKLDTLNASYKQKARQTSHMIAAKDTSISNKNRQQVKKVVEGSKKKVRGKRNKSALADYNKTVHKAEKKVKSAEDKLKSTRARFNDKISRQEAKIKDREVKTEARKFREETRRAKDSQTLNDMAQNAIDRQQEAYSKQALASAKSLVKNPSRFIKNKLIQEVSGQVFNSLDEEHKTETNRAFINKMSRGKVKEGAYEYAQEIVMQNLLKDKLGEENFTKMKDNLDIKGKIKEGISKEASSKFGEFAEGFSSTSGMKGSDVSGVVSAAGNLVSKGKFKDQSVDDKAEMISDAIKIASLALTVASAFLTGGLALAVTGGTATTAGATAGATASSASGLLGQLGSKLGSSTVNLMSKVKPDTLLKAADKLDDVADVVDKGVDAYRKVKQPIEAVRSQFSDKADEWGKEQLEKYGLTKEVDEEVINEKVQASKTAEKVREREARDAEREARDAEEMAKLDAQIEQLRKASELSEGTNKEMLDDMIANLEATKANWFNEPIDVTTDYDNTEAVNNEEEVYEGTEEVEEELEEVEIDEYEEELDTDEEVEIDTQEEEEEEDEFENDPLGKALKEREEFYASDKGKNVTLKHELLNYFFNRTGKPLNNREHIKAMEYAGSTFNSEEDSFWYWLSMNHTTYVDLSSPWDYHSEQIEMSETWTVVTYANTIDNIRDAYEVFQETEDKDPLDSFN